MKRKLLGLMLVVFVAVLPVFVNAEGKAVKIGTVEYETLKDAVEAVTDSTETTITVVADHETSGIKFQSGKNITIDLGGHTVSFAAPTVGSSGTETQDMQILKDSTIVFKNGKFVSSSTNKSKMFIQNYANLTLKDVEIVATNDQNLYGVSNNSGDVSIEGTTSIKVKEGSVAFDVCGYHAGGYPIGPKVVVNTTGTIEGTIEVTRDSGTAERELSLVIKNINHVGELSIQSGLEGNVTVEAGSYTDAKASEKLEESLEEGAAVYEVITPEGESKYVVATEEEVVKNPYIEETIQDKEEIKTGASEIVKEIDEMLVDIDKVMEELEAIENKTEEQIAALEKVQETKNAMLNIKEVLTSRNIISFNEIIYGSFIDDNFVKGSEQSELKEAIKVLLSLPENLEKVKEGYTRKYSVVRIHLNADDTIEVKELDVKDNGDGTVSFETDKFSTYILTYEDVKNVDNPKTFDGASLYIILGGLSLVGLATVSVLLKKRNA